MPDFGTICGEIMRDETCMTFCDGLCKILQDLSGKTSPDIALQSVVILHIRMYKAMGDLAQFVRQDLRVHYEQDLSGKIWPDIVPKSAVILNTMS